MPPLPPPTTLPAPPALVSPLAPARRPIAPGRSITVDPQGKIKSLSIAARLARPGDVITILPGVYHESINLTASGTAGRPITFQAQTPGSVIIDAAGFKTAISSNFAHTRFIILVGMTIRNCANPSPDDIAALSTGDGWTLQDITVDAADGTGIDIWGDGVTLLRVTAKNCGRAGLSGSGCSNVLVKDCATTANNTRSNDPADNAGAGKWNKCDHIIIDGLESANNTGTGLWFDYNNHDITITHCTIHDNHGLKHDYEGVGLSLELCPGPVLVDSNEFHNNTGANIAIRSSRQITIQNNSLSGSYLDLLDWPRGDDYTDQDFTITSNTFNNTKIFASGGTWNTSSPTQKRILFAGNTYTNTPQTLFTWGGVEMDLAEAKKKLGVETMSSPTTTKLPSP